MFLLVLIQIMKWISLNYIEKKSLLFSIFKMKMISVKEISSSIIQFLHIKELGFIKLLIHQLVMTKRTNIANVLLKQLFNYTSF